MKRYMVLEGVQGTLVTDPHSDIANRYVAQTRKSLEQRKAAKSHGDRYVPCTIAAEYHPHLVKAVSRGTLKQLGEYVYADSSADALASVSSKSKPKPKAKSEKAETSKERGNE